MNPLIRGLESSQTSPNNTNVNNIVNALKVARNPSQALLQMAQSNPQLSNVLQMCQGKDPKEVFYSECQRRGVNPDDILNQLK